MDRIKNHPILPSDKNRKLVYFTFNGEKLQGYENEPVSSALFANDIKEFSIHPVGDAPQGIFCANGQCSHCTLIINGFPLKSCITPLKKDMEVRKLVHLPDLPSEDRAFTNFELKNLDCEVLIAGGGPSGIQVCAGATVRRCCVHRCGGGH